MPCLLIPCSHAHFCLRFFLNLFERQNDEREVSHPLVHTTNLWGPEVHPGHQHGWQRPLFTPKLIYRELTHWWIRQKGSSMWHISTADDGLTHNSTLLSPHKSFKVLLYSKNSTNATNRSHRLHEIGYKYQGIQKKLRTSWTGTNEAVFMELKEIHPLGRERVWSWVLSCARGNSSHLRGEKAEVLIECRGHSLRTLEVRRKGHDLA